MNNCKLYTIIIILLCMISCSKTPKEQFLASPIGCYNYGYNLIEDNKLWQALDSGWISQDVFNLMCDLEIKGTTYVKAINTTKTLLDTIALHQCNINFPFALPDNCTKEQLLSFICNECDGYIGKLAGNGYYSRTWDTLLVKRVDGSFWRNSNKYDDLKYSTYNDTVIEIQFKVQESLRESLIKKYGNPLIIKTTKEKRSWSSEFDYYYTWANDKYIFMVHENESYYYWDDSKKDATPRFLTELTYTNRQALSSYRKASRQAMLEHAEKVRIKQLQDSIAEVRRLEAERVQAMQDSIKEEQERQKLLLDL